MGRDLIETSTADKGIEADPSKMKQFVLSKLGNVSSKVRDTFEKTDLNSMIWSQLKYRHPWELLWGNVSKGNVAVAGDAFHPMTPDIGQGGCSTLEDAVILARILAEALMRGGDEEMEIRMGLERYAKERRWRSVKLVSVAYVMGFVQQSNGSVISFFRDKVVAKFLAGLLLRMSDFDCGTLC